MRSFAAGLLLAGMWAGAPLLQDAPFTEITEEAGLDFEHDPGVTGNYFFPEVMGSGAAWLDYDNDGDLDLYLIQAGSHDGKNQKPNRLYRQSSDRTFHDVTDASGLGDLGYGMGVAVGDYDNDGFVDVFVSNYGADALYRNTGEGRFENVTARVGISGEGWSASAAFCDYDGDGYLDLYVAHYVQYDPVRPVPRTRYGDKVDPITCRNNTDLQPDYCSPRVFSGESDRLYHNNGARTFTDVSRDAGIAAVRAPGLGVVCQDLTGDGRPDFYVANDQAPNQLWENKGDGTFVDRAFESGTALDGAGVEKAGMGVSLGDLDDDGDLDLFITNLFDETNTLYRNDGTLRFQDATEQFGLAVPGFGNTGFGVAFLDFDHDGHLDIAVVNGDVARKAKPSPSAVDPFWRPYADPNLLLRNRGGGRFEDVSDGAGPFTKRMEVGRGMAVGDFDNDGDLDLLVTYAGGPARLFRNDARKKGQWLIVRAWEPALRRDAHGAIVTVTWNDRRIVRVANPGFSYLSSNDPRAHFGLPGEGTISEISICWPHGGEELFGSAAPNQILVLERGRGKPVTDGRSASSR